MDWKSEFSGKFFITDLGESQEASVGGQTVVLGRYAVWAPMKNADRHQVVEVGNELEALAKKYGLCRETVLKLVHPGAEHG
ncbi:MAG: hypothetical protein FWD46_05390 [Cystobacterineae bacterium]|nr:hypothetical protein [Cystobacterineae bacterium]